jgi:hypothetical protein
MNAACGIQLPNTGGTRSFLSRVGSADHRSRPRPAFELEQGVPGRISSGVFNDPIMQSIELKEATVGFRVRERRGAAPLPKFRLAFVVMGRRGQALRSIRQRDFPPPSCAPGEREQLRACALTGNLVVVLNGRLAYRWMPTCAPAIFTLGTVEYHRKTQEEGQGKETLPGLLGYPKLKGS